MDAPLQKHWESGAPAQNIQEVSEMYRQAKLDSVKFEGNPNIDYTSEFTSRFPEHCASPAVNLKSKF